MSDLLGRLENVVGDAYRIDRELGGGGMSRVFLAEEVELGRKVVIKVLPPEMAAGVNKERFQREIKLAASLQHPHIVPLLTAGTAGPAESADLIYYVMPYIEGESLRAKLAREGELPIGETVRILREVVDALAYAHRRDVVHRDIKPDNVLLSEEHALVTDFGVAKAVSASSGGSHSSLTSLGVALGTPAYMSPEQAAADPHVDHRADIYAVGALAYEMLCGRPPFAGSTPQQILAAHVSQTPDPVTQHRDTIPPAMADMVMRCLAKRAADRWQTAGDVKAVLETMTTPPSGGMTPTGTQPVSAATAGAALARHHPVRVAALFGVAAAMTLVVVYGLMIMLGLPDWVFVGAVVLLAIGLPIIVVTARQERDRAEAATTGLYVTTPVGLQKYFTWRKAIAGGGLAFAALGIGVMGFMGMRAAGIGPAATLVTAGVLEQRDRIVLADFADRSGASGLSETATELFRIDLEQSPAVLVVEAARIAAVLARMNRDPDASLTADVAREVARREGFKAVIAGDILPAGSGFVVSARLTVASTGEVVWADREATPDADGIVAAVDRLSAKLRERVGESLRSIRAEPPLHRVTTASLEALQKYAEAERVNDLGDFDVAIDLLEEALQLDSTFAMAHRKLGIILGNTVGDPVRRDEAYTRAFELRGKLTDRERYLVEEGYYRSIGDGPASISALRRLLERYPEDRIGLNNLAGNYLRLRRWEDAEEYYRRLIATGNEAAVTYRGAVRVLLPQRKFAAADSMLQRWQERFPGSELELWRGLVAVARGDYEVAEDHWRPLRTAERGNLFWEWLTPLSLAQVDLLRGKLTEAAALGREALAAQARRGLLPGGEALAAVLASAELDLWIRGEVDRVVDAVDRALQQYPLDTIRPNDRPFLQAADLYARAGRTDRARELIADFESETDALHRERQAPQYHGVLGVIALEEGRPDEAMVEFRRSYEVGTSPLEHLFDLARAYDESGQLDSAVAAYDRFVNTPRALGLYFDRPEARPLTFRRLGELYEARGDSEKAVEYYHEFVEVWKDADAELQPQVEDVRQRIARLVGERR